MCLEAANSPPVMPVASCVSASYVRIAPNDYLQHVSFSTYLSEIETFRHDEHHRKVSDKDNPFLLKLHFITLLATVV